MQIKDAVFVYHLREPEAINWHGRHHRHGPGDYEIHYFLGGGGSFHNGDTVHSLRPGSLFVSPPEVHHRIEANDVDDPITYYAILLQLEESDEQVRELFEDELSWKEGHRIGERYRFFFEELREKSLSDVTYLRRSAVYQLISFLFMLAAEDEGVYLGNQDNIHIEKALQYMHRQVFVKTRLSGLAQKLKLSQEYFIRLFKQKLKTTPMKYLTKLRVEAATSMLISSDMLVYQIADKLQFHSEFHFSRVFKQYTGLSPRNYRNTYRQLIGKSPEHESVIYMQGS